MTGASQTATQAPRETALARLPSPPAIHFHGGTLEVLKWLGLVLMTFDHINKYAFDGAEGMVFSVGRMTLPLFCFVLSYNMARPDVLANASQVFPRVLLRLVICAVLASVPFAALGGLAGGWWPLNIMATFTVAVGAMYLLHAGGRWRKAAAVALVVVGGGLVEYWWPAICMCLAMWFYCRRPSWAAAAAALASTAALTLTGWAFGAMPLANSSLWALMAFPLILLRSRATLNVPRLKWLYYAYYPAHLCVLWLMLIAP